jgi:hypothetical protein
VDEAIALIETLVSKTLDTNAEQVGDLRGGCRPSQPQFSAPR